LGNRRYPPIDQGDFAKILRKLFGEPARTKGDHEYFAGTVNGKPAFAQNDTGRDPVFNAVIMRTIESCNVTREEFYGVLKGTAKAAGCKYLKDWRPK
jgi:hypothetical protein